VLISRVTERCVRRGLGPNGMFRTHVAGTGPSGPVVRVGHVLGSDRTPRLLASPTEQSARGLVVVPDECCATTSAGWPYTEFA